MIILIKETGILHFFKVVVACQVVVDHSFGVQQDDFWQVTGIPAGMLYKYLSITAGFVGISSVTVNVISLS